ncbi:MAG: hypothetical protein Q7J98_06400 [Kiritimatiellia bacterium]|nr:hypothetical protein [Kiritimatiellia bacterium]
MTQLNSGQLRLHSKRNSLHIGNQLFFCELSRETAGFPRRLGFEGRSEPVVLENQPWLRATRNGSSAIFPVLEKWRPHILEGKDEIKVWIQDIGWQDEKGRRLKGFRLDLSYEFHADGAVFVKSFFFTDTVTPGVLTDFILAPTFRPKKDENVRWALWKFPKRAEGQIIQDWGHFERNLTPSDNRRLPMILPFVSFDFGRGERRDHHVEFFVESWNALTLDPANTETEVAWKDGQAAIRWNFETRSCPLKQPDREWRGVVPNQPYQWRNTWGWCLRRFPVERKHPPFRVFHYIDNYKRFPDARIISQVAAQGANLFIIHENWRFDPKSGEFPEDMDKLKNCIRLCHRHKMRVALYVRGNEDCIRENMGSYILPLLRKNWDGLYMDYGSPMGYFGVEEYAPGGRVHFQEYYTSRYRLRERLGPEGVYISHSGSFFSAIGHTTVDAYLGGEQEKGALIRDRETHAYFAGLSVAPSSLWTAAFPTYRTKKIIPFLAATLQFPFLHLGTQFPRCSLDHPRAPSLIRFARPLWRLWEILDGQTDIRAYTMQSTENIFRPDSADTAASLLVTARGDCLLTATNFSDQERDLKVDVAWRKLGLKPGRLCYALHVNEETTSFETVKPGTSFKARVEGYGLAGWLLARSSTAWAKALRNFVRPYPSFPADERKHRQMIDTLCRLRFQPPAWKEWFLRVSLPNEPSRYEPSLLYDLFENVIELQVLREGQPPKRLGYISRKGLVSEVPQRADYIWPGTATPWLPLHTVAKAASGNVVRLALATRKGAGEFYSFIMAELSPVPGPHAHLYEVRYNNDIDLDWSAFGFNIRLP